MFPITRYNWLYSYLNISMWNCSWSCHTDVTIMTVCIWRASEIWVRYFSSSSTSKIRRVSKEPSNTRTSYSILLVAIMRLKILATTMFTSRVLLQLQGIIKYDYFWIMCSFCIEHCGFLEPAEKLVSRDWFTFLISILPSIPNHLQWVSLVVLRFQSGGESKRYEMNFPMLLFLKRQIFMALLIDS